MSEFVIGVDVGSGSARAGLYRLDGTRLGMGLADILIRNPEAGYAEQSSENIWDSCCTAIKAAVRESGVSPDEVKRISFDATCSLVALDGCFQPVSVAKDLNPYWNIIMWMDHRAQKEADEINSRPHDVLRYVGGKISVEMEIPKIMWLKRNLPDQYKKTAKFFDLADFLLYKACGKEIRSTCTVTCKWTYLAHEKKWSPDFFQRCGISELLQNQAIGTQFEVPGVPAGSLSSQAAQAMGLSTDCICIVGMIDAHAGGVGAAGIQHEGTLSIIAGTSACHMLNTKKPIFVPGIWGPYYGAMIDGLWLNEGGQSAAGALIDYTVHNHAHYPSLLSEAKERQISLFEILNQEVSEYKKQKALNFDLHILGYHHGNRSPRADASLRGMVSGLSLDMGKEGLTRLYWAAIQSICYGTRHIIEASIKSGHKIGRIVVCGGATKNPLWLQELADITGYSIEIPYDSEAVLLGSAVIAAGDLCGGVIEAAKKMCRTGQTYKPDTALKAFHEKKYAVFLQMYSDYLHYRKQMS